MTKRNIYLKTIDIEEAKELYYEKFANLYTCFNETILIHNALGRVTFQPHYASISNPHYNASAMDGIALDAAVTYGAHERNAIELRENSDFVYVDTGDPINEPYNAVVMIEDVYPKGEGVIELRKASYPWEHVRVVGEDIAVGDMILPSNHKITPVDMGALLSGGLTHVKVHKQMKVGLLPTGSEIVNPGSDLKVGSIIDSNSRVFEAMVKEAGGLAKRYQPIKDDKEMLRQGILKAVEENDMVVINAGSSAGTEDYTAELIRELGEVYVHGIAIKPGKPTILGNINGKAVIGIPGYPVSAFIAFRAFVVPFVEGNTDNRKTNIKKVLLTKRVVSALKHKEYVRIKAGYVGNKLIGTPLSRGAGATMSLVKADGILTIPKEVEGYEAGTEVNVELIRPMKLIKKSLVSIGSHDIIMDQINDLMKKNPEGCTLSSAHVGSLGGIMAIKKGETHIAPVHLLDENTGEYNCSFIKKYLKNEDVFLLKGIKRWQGLYVKKGNPLNIKTLKDIVNNKYIFANRQRGSGTRTLLDYELNKTYMDKKDVVGYEREFTTHTSVALAVKSGNAQVGLGIESVGRLMNLDFIPLALEDYDFIIPENQIDNETIKAFLSALKSDPFKDRLKELRGYEIHPFEMISMKPE